MKQCEVTECLRVFVYFVLFLSVPRSLLTYYEGKERFSYEVLLFLDLEKLVWETINPWHNEKIILVLSLLSFENLYPWKHYYEIFPSAKSLGPEWLMAGP